MDKEFADVIKLMARKQGKEVLVNGKAKTYLADYCKGQFVDEADIFRRMLDAGCGEHINNADNLPEIKQKLMEQLEDSKGLSPKVTAEYLDLFGLILRGDKSKSGKSIPVQPTPPETGKPATTLTSETDDGITWTYTGGVRNGKRHGKGKCTYADGRVYEGDFVDGKIHGKGKSTYANGNVYEGDFVDGKKHGIGKFTYSYGDVYEGDFVDGKIHGKGKYTYADGDVWEGDWVDGKQHGKGKFISANGESYEGDWVDNKLVNTRTSKGKKTYTDSSAGEKKGGDKMGFIYCPNCGQSVSNQAKISACPKCYHPFNAKEWQKIQAKKDAQAAEEKRKQDAIAAEKKRKKDEEEQRLNYAKDNDKCPLCHKPISWEEKMYSEFSSYRGESIFYTFRHPYCQSCGWKSPLAFEKSGESYGDKYTSIADWEKAVESCQGHHGY